MLFCIICLTVEIVWNSFTQPCITNILLSKGGCMRFKVELKYISYNKGCMRFEVFSLKEI